MCLTEIVSKYQNELLDKGVLVDYDLYFEEIEKNTCRFVIDESDELEVLRSIIRELKDKDDNAKVYVNTYGIDFKKKEIYIYADSLWIDTIMEIDDIYDLFINHRNIEPTDIVMLEDDETINGTVSLMSIMFTRDVL